MRSFTLIYIEQLRGAVKQQNLRRKKKSLQSTTASRCYGNKAAIKKKKKGLRDFSSSSVK